MGMHEKLNKLRKKRQEQVIGRWLKMMPYIFIIFLLSIIILGVIL